MHVCKWRESWRRFRVQGLRFKVLVQSSGFRVLCFERGLLIDIEISLFTVSGSGFRVQGSVFCVLCSVFRKGFANKLYHNNSMSSVFRVLGSEFRVQCFVFRQCFAINSANPSLFTLHSLLLTFTTDLIIRIIPIKNKKPEMAIVKNQGIWRERISWCESCPW